MKNLDLISTHIKFNYDGFRNHASIFGFILTVLVLCITIAFGIYEGRELWEKKKPISNVLNGYTADSGVYHLGIGGINHFYNIMSREGEFIEYDEKAVIIESKLMNRENKLLGTYKYKKCIWEFDGIDFHQFSKNVNKDKYEKAACIREFLNSTTLETIVLDINTKDFFPFPNITHGMESTVPLSEKNVYFTTFRECNISSKIEDCYSKKKIEEYYKDHFYVFAFIDKNFDITNHKEPIKSTYNQVEGLMSLNSFTANHLNLNPSSVISDDGAIFEVIKTQRSVYLYQNEKISEERKGNPTLTQVNFWLKNQETVYSRGYAKIQDIFANIGGFFNFLYYSALIINFLPEKFTLMKDTVDLLESNKYIYEKEKKELMKVNVEKKLQANKEEKMDKSDKSDNNSNIKNLDISNLKNDEINEISSTNNLRKTKTISLNLTKSYLKDNKNVDKKEEVISSINFFDLLLNIFWKSRKPEIDRLDYLRQKIMSENNIFREFFNSKKKRKTLFEKDELKLLNNTPIYDEEFNDLM